MIKREDIQIRDPFILAYNGYYYLYGTTDKNCWSDEATGFDSYKSRDLENWEGPFEAFRPDEDFWADKHFWAPEVYRYNDRFYMFASFKKDGIPRGTQILVSDTPDGRFIPYSDGPVTPKNWECLDGTLYIDKKGDPWMVFCHEWTQTVDGEMCAVRLSEDLKTSIGDPTVLFKASDAGWTKGSKQTVNGEEETVYVTDGPFMYRTKDQKLLMLWSSGGELGYAIGIAQSDNGDITGSWSHQKELLFKKDGGHGMIFTDYSGKIFVTLHSPNKTPNERPHYFEAEEKDGTLKLMY